MADPSIPPTEIIQNKEDVANFVSAIALAFHSPPNQNPLTTTFTTEIDSTPPPYPSPSITAQRFTTHFSTGILNSFTAGAVLICSPSIHAPSALAVWEPPNFAGVPFNQSHRGPGPCLQEWQATTKRMKATYLGAYDATGRYYHLGFLARNPDPGVAKVKGAVSAVVMPFLDRARAEGVPVWLEATSADAVAIYEFFGFRVCEEGVIGRGRVDGRGWPTEGGEGARWWGMVFDAHLR